jgi:hypothetical protein
MTFTQCEITKRKPKPKLSPILPSSVRHPLSLRPSNAVVSLNHSFESEGVKNGLTKRGYEWMRVLGVKFSGEIEGKGKGKEREFGAEWDVIARIYGSRWESVRVLPSLHLREFQIRIETLFHFLISAFISHSRSSDVSSHRRFTLYMSLQINASLQLIFPGHSSFLKLFVSSKLLLSFLFPLGHPSPSSALVEVLSSPLLPNVRGRKCLVTSG